MGHKYEIAPLAKTVVREVVHAPSKAPAWDGSTPGYPVHRREGLILGVPGRTRAERLRELWANSGVHDAFTAHWRTWGGGNR